MKMAAVCEQLIRSAGYFQSRAHYPDWEKVLNTAKTGTMGREEFAIKGEELSFNYLDTHHGIASKAVASGHWPADSDEFEQTAAKVKDFDTYLKLQLALDPAESHIESFREIWDVRFEQNRLKHHKSVLGQPSFFTSLVGVMGTKLGQGPLVATMNLYPTRTNMYPKTEKKIQQLLEIGWGLGNSMTEKTAFGTTSITSDLYLHQYLFKTLKLDHVQQEK